MGTQRCPTAGAAPPGWVRAGGRSARLSSCLPAAFPVARCRALLLRTLQHPALAVLYPSSVTRASTSPYTADPSLWTICGSGRRGGDQRLGRRMAEADAASTLCPAHRQARARVDVIGPVALRLELPDDRLCKDEEPGNNEECSANAHDYFHGDAGAVTDSRAALEDRTGCCLSLASREVGPSPPRRPGPRSRGPSSLSANDRCAKLATRRDIRQSHLPTTLLTAGGRRSARRWAFAWHVGTTSRFS